MLVAGAVHELSEAVVLQMIGRAGRPQFDDHGVAVIMTQNSKVVSFSFQKFLFYFLLFTQILFTHSLKIKNWGYSTKKK